MLEYEQKSFTETLSLPFPWISSMHNSLLKPGLLEKTSWYWSKFSCLVHCNSEIWMSVSCTGPEEKCQVADNTILQLFTEKIILLCLRIKCLHLFRKFYWHIMDCNCEWSFSTFTCLCLSIPSSCLPKKALILLSIPVNIRLLKYSLVNFRRWKRTWVFIITVYNA